MSATKPLKRWLVMAAVVIPWTIVWPSPDGLREPTQALDAPLDEALRVPFAATFLRTANPAFEPHDRVLDLTFDGEDQLIPPRNRAELLLLARERHGDRMSIRLIRDRDPVTVRANTTTQSGWRSLGANWPTLFLGAAFLLFGLAVGLGSQHPVASPLFAVSWCAGAWALSQVDLMLPEDPGLHGIPSLRSRLGLVSVTLLPASFIHLAMRFPVVSPRFRSVGAALAPYGFWLFPAAFAQFHIQNAAFLNSLERIAIGAAFLAAGILIAGSITSSSTMTPIERARSRALLLGLGVGSAVPLVYFLWGGTPPTPLRTPFILSLLAFPASISWAIVRYRLLDPPMWVQSAVLTGLTASVALLLASGGVSFAFSFLDEAEPLGSAEVIPVALTTTVLYQLLHFVLRRGAAGRVLRERAFESFLEEASQQLASARHPKRVLEGIEPLIRTHLGASEVKCLLEEEAATCSEPLVNRGLELWRRERKAPEAIVRARSRAEDPGPDVPEIVLPLLPRSTAKAFVFVGSRSDGLPYGEDHVRMLVSLRHVATTALEAATTAADLEERVAEKTTSLERALSDRQAVLGAARAICEADGADEVLATLRGFAAAHQASLRWEGGTEGAHMLKLAIPGEPVRLLELEGIAPQRAEELAPQLGTLCAFAGLAIGRLNLLAELKLEVERQAEEIAEISSRRLHAEFVRGVAHELRKPTEEVRRRVEDLGISLAPEHAEALRRIRAASREMSRRLDLLLFHSGVRLDLQRIDLVRVVEDAVATTRLTCPDRDYRLGHDLARIPMIGDPSRLLSVVENLLDNAAKATSAGQAIEVHTSLEAGSSSGGAQVRLEVVDEGRGIPPDRLEVIFQPGVGLEPGGFGLGLSLCREIVRMHAGTIEVASKLGRTSFCIRLPQFRSGEDDDRDSIDSVG